MFKPDEYFMSYADFVQKLADTFEYKNRFEFSVETDSCLRDLYETIQSEIKTAYDAGWDKGYDDGYEDGESNTSES